MINIQPVEKLVLFDGSYDVHSIFYTIQGEGPYSGEPAVFIRLAGCNLQCPKCDTEYTDFNKRRPLTTASILKEVERVSARRLNQTGKLLVVITGGEPFRQDLTDLIWELTSDGYKIQIETNGTMPISARLQNCDIEFTIVCSPKTSKVQESIRVNACYWKYVISSEEISVFNGLVDDFPTTALANNNLNGLAHPPEWVLPSDIFVQPCDEQNEALNLANLQKCIELSMVHGYTLQLQTHKLIGME